MIANRRILISLCGFLLFAVACSREPGQSSTSAPTATKDQRGIEPPPAAKADKFQTGASLAEQVFGSKITGEARKNLIRVDADSLRSQLGKEESLLLDSGFPGRNPDTVLLANGDRFLLFAGPFSSTVSAVGLKIRGEKVAAVNVTMQASGEGLALKKEILGGYPRQEDVTTRMGGPDMKGQDVRYMHFGKDEDDFHILLYEDQGMINLIMLKTGVISLSDALPSLKDLPEISTPGTRR